MEFGNALEQVTKDWGYVQLYGPDEDANFEVRLPRYDKTGDLMYGEGENLEDAIMDLLEKMSHIEGKPVAELEAGIEEAGSDMNVAGGEIEGEAEVRSEDEAEGYLFAQPGGQGKFHLFGPEGESLCGRATLPDDYDGEVQALGERQPDTETDCKLCLKELNQEDIPGL